MSYCILPIDTKDRPLYELYKKAVASFWVSGDVQVTLKDKTDWEKLSDDEKYYIKHILAFFAGSDGIVAENLALRFYGESESPIVKLFYGFQIAIEGIHSEVYANMIESFVSDKEEKHMLFNAILNYPAIKKKSDWCLRYIKSSDDFRERLIAFAVCEGIFFSGAFCSIFWLKSRGICPVLGLGNQFIARDEGLHCEFAVEYYKQFEPLPPETIQRIITDGVDIEIEFITEALPVRLIGMNETMMKEYIKYVANRLCVQLGVPKPYKRVKNPFSFMEMISLEGKTNFFENKVSEYSIGRERANEKEVFNLNSDF
jgi:ribonucleotide reductase beta subunit family protein with ferritin-like domain